MDEQRRVELRALFDVLSRHFAPPSKEEQTGREWANFNEVESAVAGWVSTAANEGRVNRADPRSALQTLEAHAQWAISWPDRYNVVVQACQLLHA